MTLIGFLMINNTKVHNLYLEILTFLKVYFNVFVIAYIISNLNDR